MSIKNVNSGILNEETQLGCMSSPATDLTSLPQHQLILQLDECLEPRNIRNLNCSISEKVPQGCGLWGWECSAQLSAPGWSGPRAGSLLVPAHLPSQTGCSQHFSRHHVFVRHLLMSASL